MRTHLGNLNNRLSRLRALTQLEGSLQTHQSELHDLRELQEEKGGGENLFEELEAQWKEAQTAFCDRWARKEKVLLWFELVLLPP